MRRLIQLVIPGVFLSGCFGPSEGVEVPQDEIYFPVGLALDEGSRHLFVVSSDFDLQFNGGAVQSYDIALLNEALPTRCLRDADCESSRSGSVCQPGGMCAASSSGTPCLQGDRADADRLLFPGRCNPIVPSSVRDTGRKTTVKIGAFATDAILRPRPQTNVLSGAPERLFIPVRGDSTLHWIDVENGELDCGQLGASDGACNGLHRAGDDKAENVRELKLNAEPFAIDADAAGRNIVVTNQTTGTASLFTNDWSGQGPKLAFALASERIPQRPVGVAAVPQPLAVGEESAPNGAFMMTFRDSAQVRLVRFAPDSPQEDSLNQPRPYLVDGGGIGIEANSVGSDSRGIAIDGSARQAAKDRCAAGDTQCASDAGLVPLDVYVANRAPSTLLIGRTRPTQEYPYFFDSVPLTAGPSRIVIGKVSTPRGDETRVFVACFDSRRIFVYDPQRSRIETEILTGRGPHAMVVDALHKQLYVGHFTDSYVGVYSLDLASPATYGTMLGTLGQPKSPRSSK